MFRSARRRSGKRKEYTPRRLGLKNPVGVDRSGDLLDIIEGNEQAEHDCNRRRLSQKLIKIGKLNCCSLAENDVPSEPHLPYCPPQIPARQEHKPFNGICVLPNMPAVEALIQEFEASYSSKSPIAGKKSATAGVKAKGLFVKKIIEIYETKKERIDPWPLDGQQVNTKATVEDERRPKRSNLFRTVQALKKVEKARDDAEKRELPDATVNSVSRKVERNDEKKNDLDGVEETSELTAVVPNFHINMSSSKRKRGRAREKQKEKSSRNLRGFLCKFNRSSSKRVTRRCRLMFPQQDELWHVKRNGRIFLEPLNKNFISSCDNAAHSNSSCPDEDNSRNIDNLDVLTVTESQDDSGNSYKNLQIDVFDFEDKGSRSETQDPESDDSLSIKSVDQFLPSLDRQNSYDETTYFASSSFEDENTLSDSVNDYDQAMATELSVFADESSTKDCLEQPTNIQNVYLRRESRLQQIFSGKKLKRILSLFNTKRCFQKETKSAIDKRKYSWQLLRKSQQPMMSPDSGFGEQSISVISSSTLPTSSFFSEKSACNNHHESTLTFKTFRPRDSLPRESISRGKRRLVLNELSHEKLTSGQNESSCAILDTQTEILRCDLFPVSSSPSKGSTSTASSPRSRVSPLRLLKPYYLSQKIPRSTFLSLTRVDESGEKLDEQLDMSELRPEYSASLNFLNGWRSSSPYQAHKEPRWRSTPVLASFARKSSCYSKEPISCEKRPVHYIYRDAKRHVPIFGTSSLSNITGSTCFATVKPRNWRPYMRPTESSSFGENDDVKRRSSV